MRCAQRGSSILPGSRGATLTNQSAGEVGGVQRILNACRYSWAGLRAAWQHETAFRQELVAAVVLTPVAVWLAESRIEMVLLLATLWLVLLVELLNSAIEAVVDRHGEAHHPLAGRAKDLGSAAVLVSLSITALTWGVIVLGSAW